MRILCEFLRILASEQVVYLCVLIFNRQNIQYVSLCVGSPGGGGGEEREGRGDDELEFARNTLSVYFV